MATTMRLPQGGNATLPQKQRACGVCTACCGPTLVVNEPDHVKARGEICPHRTEAGCSVWNTGLPEICRTYLCNYLVEPRPLTEAERPDRAGAILQRRERDVLLAETFADGLGAIFANDCWRECIAQSLRAGEMITASFWDDPYDAELLHVRRAGGRWGVALAACDEDGTPVIFEVATARAGCVLKRPLIVGVDELPFDGDALVAHLGDREAAVLKTHSPLPGGDGVLCFRVTRRQVALLERLRRVESG